MNIFDGWFPFLIAILSIFITCILLYKCFPLAMRPKRKAVLLCGICNSGKTVMFMRFVTDRFVQTFLSVRENFSAVTVSGNRLELIDIPGAEELRITFLNSHLKRGIRGIIYVIDSSTFAKQCKEVAQYLYNLLCALLATKNHRVKVLIACGKQDIVTAKSSNILKANLEKELDLLNRSERFALGTTEIGGVSGSLKKTLLLDQRDDGLFSFDKLPITVQFCECSSKVKNHNDNDIGLKDVELWLKRAECKQQKLAFII
ncbi:Signal recognition particle receptor subunit beta [Trichinella pseudospiralis]|uniref:Signal recognition particle receptor subunit beta n=2 Tax=Trichinella pseudospiralis TaxID=6337 RepID=A0A0V1JQ49_TRIPS|nr:Signal recognition particle receptor subunit beta [Trichinella pseudospiralis]KRY71254.1 Signal recognition particle receptor subunit beta [Trichinella pseudospiralis]KRY88244.1 Signal recognition particle receptor subunit beta [Trichinella pseudospiralis]KRZ37099.1 Signal recognition particle receptor subunit beta [Trichinella pseudospiralis]KRZ37100.1 Signal recognition particle receptor subunit beta [Trichinella pseudospiralis]